MNSPFLGISNEDKKKLFTLLGVHIYNFDKDEDILSIIKDDNVICIIDNGNAEIIRINYDGNRSIIDELSKDSIFGTTISSITSNDFEIITKEKTTVIVIDYENFLNNNFIHYDYYNIFIQNIFSIINENIKKKNERIKILTQRSIRNKLLEYFKLNQTDYRSKYVYLPFSFTELADYLAIDRCAMTRELKYLKEERLIEIKGKRITILY